MFNVEVTIELPFFLRLEGSISVKYDEVCKKSVLQELSEHDIKITFSRRPAASIDKSDISYERSTIMLKLEAQKQLSGDSINFFATRNCLEILNRIITSYQVTTGDVNNAGFIFSMGTSDMQLFADIRVNGMDIRDRWPFHKYNTIPLSKNKETEFKAYLTNQQDLPLSNLFFTNAALSLERGQYPLAILQAATAVELRITQVICGKLMTAGWSDKAIKPYTNKTLGGKLKIPNTDLRSLETYFNGVKGFPDVYMKVKDNLTPLRNNVAHRGYLASDAEAVKTVKIARDFLKIVK